jgi:hypothetical protein
MKKIWHEFRRQIFFGVVLAAGFGWLAFMVADTAPPYEYDVERSYIVPSKAHDGDQITVMWKLAKINRICPGSNRRILFDPRTRVILASYDPTPAAVSESIHDGLSKSNVPVASRRSPRRAGRLSRQRLLRVQSVSAIYQAALRLDAGIVFHRRSLILRIERFCDA